MKSTSTRLDDVIIFGQEIFIFDDVLPADAVDSSDDEDFDEENIEPFPIKMQLVGFRLNSENHIQDAESAVTEFVISHLLHEPSPEKSNAESVLKDTIFQKLNLNYICPIPESDFVRMDGWEKICKSLVSLFIKVEVERLKRIEKLTKNQDIEELNLNAPEELRFRIPNSEEFLERLVKSTSAHFSDLILQRLFLAVTQLALEARSLSPDQTITKAFDKEVSNLITRGRARGLAIRGNLSDGRGMKPGAKMFDREQFLSGVKKEILKVYEEGTSSRDITEKLIANNLSIGNIGKGTGESTIRKRLRKCGVLDKWGAFVDATIKEASLHKRKSKKAKSKIRPTEL